MRNVDIVLGLQYGDEGKGVTVDYLCNKYKNREDNYSDHTAVIRFSGGPQAGHTVMADGKKHIHSSFGSGTLRHNTPTFFSKHSLIYPISIAKELEVLKEKGITPNLRIDPLATLITPIDVINNRRDSENLHHGTCGLGIGKSMQRQKGPFKFYAADLLYPRTLLRKLATYMSYIRHELDENQLKYLMNELMLFRKAVVDITWNIEGIGYLNRFKNLIFEGSQGIMLDMDHGEFPNVTYANTTSKNALEMLKEMHIIDYSTYYVTRTYATRHGNGPFEEHKIDLINNEEEINVSNIMQGDLRIGNLDTESITQALHIDSLYNSYWDKRLVITCMDQMPKGYKFPTEKIGMIFSEIYESWGPDSNKFKKI